jgi:protein tyrosine phosphatase
MTKYITRCVVNGTKIDVAIAGKDVDTIMTKLRRNRMSCVRNANVYLFIHRKTEQIIDMRFN